MESGGHGVVIVTNQSRWVGHAHEIVALENTTFAELVMENPPLTVQGDLLLATFAGGQRIPGNITSVRPATGRVMIFLAPDKPGHDWWR